MGILAENIELFSSAHAALTFAYQFSCQAYDRPLMNRLSDKPSPPGKGLAGLDGAAQSGIIRAMVASLGGLFENIIIARYAPRSVPCSCKKSCCKGYKDNQEWVCAVAWLADHMRTTALLGCTTNGLMRREYVSRYFTKKSDRSNLLTLAAKNGVADRTVFNHMETVRNYFGEQVKRKEAIHGQEYRALQAVDEKLYQAGLTPGVSHGLPP